jgi:hypothetical protein
MDCKVEADHSEEENTSNASSGIFGLQEPLNSDEIDSEAPLSQFPGYESQLPAP